MPLPSSPVSSPMRKPRKVSRVYGLFDSDSPMAWWRWTDTATNLSWRFEKALTGAQRKRQRRAEVVGDNFYHPMDSLPWEPIITDPWAMHKAKKAMARLGLMTGKDLADPTKI